MPYGSGSKAEIEQREDAARKHGAYALKDRGEVSLKPAARGRVGELEEMEKERAGVLELMQDTASKAVLMVELLTGWIANQKNMGVPFDEIPALKVLPAFMNTATRALKDLLSEMHDEEGVIDAERILDEIKLRINDDKATTKDG
jgi:hypothetical protein